MATSAALLLFLAFTVELSIAATTVTYEPPLLLNTYIRSEIDGDDQPKECQGDPDGYRFLVSTTILEEENDSFCECFVQGATTTDIACEKLVYNYCPMYASNDMDGNLLESWEAHFTVYTCYDDVCGDCDLGQETLLEWAMKPPPFQPLPAAESCWSNRIGADFDQKLFKQFEPSADPQAVDAYWQVYRENTCMREIPTGLIVSMEDTTVETVTYDPPLLYNTYNRSETDDNECQGEPDGTRALVSTTVLRDRYLCDCFQDNPQDPTELACERVEYWGCPQTNSNDKDGNLLTSWSVEFYTSKCFDDVCEYCDQDLWFEWRMTPPEFQPLPAADSCWLNEEVFDGKLFKQFEASADSQAVDDYWQIHRDRSCMRNIPTTEPGDGEDSPPAVESSNNNRSPTNFLESLADFLASVLTNPGQ